MHGASRCTSEAIKCTVKSAIILGLHLSTSQLLSLHGQITTDDREENEKGTTQEQTTVTLANLHSLPSGNRAQGPKGPHSSHRSESRQLCHSDFIGDQRYQRDLQVIARISALGAGIKAFGVVPNRTIKQRSRPICFCANDNSDVYEFEIVEIRNLELDYSLLSSKFEFEIWK